MLECDPFYEKSETQICKFDVEKEKTKRTKMTQITIVLANLLNIYFIVFAVFLPIFVVVCTRFFKYPLNTTTTNRNCSISEQLSGAVAVSVSFQLSHNTRTVLCCVTKWKRNTRRIYLYILGSEHGGLI